MTEPNYPTIFEKADRKSLSAQRNFINLNKGILFLLVVSTFLSSIKTDENWTTLVSSILLVISLVLTILIMLFKPEKTWYDGRAIAESAKSLTWKFITGTKPFGFKLKMRDAEEKLIKNLKQIIGQKKEFFQLIGEEFGEGDQITKSMMDLRKLELKEKIELYSSQRLDVQRKWYYNKSKENRKNKNLSFGAIITFQVLAILSLILDYFGFIDFMSTPLMACLASSFIAWLQLKKFQELTESYGITATELNLIKSKVRHIKDESDFENFVDDAETAISREHTLWLARRDSTELFK
ncbi:DUF4231 domain-containing protein [Hyunsoonleella pacifica]|uniref:DUF4231 domain-containing protein n=1 Tax=Hyunsoonleella pacifica TaxID=1080224 RepID=A0A4Q9FTT9_9FLAO|nr:DUF4231 domain-containing protein [Hyunsoonleella pacifica]TBN17569.1 DUF4231 domain-containing protein [Hyunsoonleella pacifica]GGD10816.1 membrane protein [Hyunsoonleella pacifica]